MYRAAVCAIISELNRQDRLKIVDAFDVAEPKTKAMIAKLNELGVTRPLIVTESATDSLYLASRNLPYVQVVDVDGLNPMVLVGAENVIMTADAVKKVEEWLA
jgi:large subunit ribosomal protein L4